MWAEQMANPVPFTTVSIEQLKVSGCFSLIPPPPSPKVQIANMTKGQISAREKGVEQLFHQAAAATAVVHADKYSPERGLVITPHRSE